MTTNSNTTMAFITNRQRYKKKEAIRQAGVIMSADGCIILRKVAKSLAPFPISTDFSLFNSSDDSSEHTRQTSAHTDVTAISVQ